MSIETLSYSFLILIPIITQYSGLYRYDSHIFHFQSDPIFNGKFKEFLNYEKWVMKHETIK
jgi:hypothetical protein